MKNVSTKQIVNKNILISDNISKLTVIVFKILAPFCKIHEMAYLSSSYSNKCKWQNPLSIASQNLCVIANVAFVP